MFLCTGNSMRHKMHSSRYPLRTRSFSIKMLHIDGSVSPNHSIGFSLSARSTILSQCCQSSRLFLVHIVCSQFHWTSNVSDAHSTCARQCERVSETAVRMKNVIMAVCCMMAERHTRMWTKSKDKTLTHFGFECCRNCSRGAEPEKYTTIELAGSAVLFSETFCDKKKLTKQKLL